MKTVFYFMEKKYGLFVQCNKNYYHVICSVNLKGLSCYRMSGHKTSIYILIYKYFFYIALFNQYYSISKNIIVYSLK